MSQSPTLIYNPGVQVVIETTDRKTGKKMMIDVSEDLVQGSLIRRSDGISQFSFSIQNPGRKYDYPFPIFAPNDRIIVSMKRVKWLRVFTGYLDVVPIFQVWPNTVSLAASCSLKQLQYFFWDSTLEASTNLINTALFSDSGDGDGGIKNVIMALLHFVVGWDLQKVHIGQIPSGWFDLIAKIAAETIQDLNVANQTVQDMLNALGGNGTVAGVAASGSATGALSVGSFAGVSLDAAQCAICETIYNVGVQKKATTKDVICAIMCGMQESSLVNLTGGDRDSVGVFQQRPSQGWGTVQQCENVAYAASSFYSRLLQDTYRAGEANATSIQKVQASADGSLYAKWQDFATAVVTDIAKGIKQNYSQTTSALPNVPSQGTANSKTFVSVALDLVQNYQIPYQEGGDSVPSTAAAQVKLLDCSSFTQWVYYHTLGSPGGFPRTAAQQAQWCQSNGGKKLSGADGMNTIGALLFKGSNEASAYHIETSLGNGQQSVGAHSPGTVASVVQSANYWDFAYTIPSLTYDNVGGGGGSTVGSDVNSTGSTSGTSQDNPFAPQPNQQIKTDVNTTANDKLDQLFNGLSGWVPVPDGSGMAVSQALTGIRSLLNDEPIMPYIKNLVNSAMRSFCSAPNGDFVSWFPDYFGIWGTAGIMNIQDIEIIDFNVQWSDQQLVTHQFIGQAPVSQFEDATGQLTPGANDAAILTTAGVASIDDKSIMQLLFGYDLNDQDQIKFTQAVYQRFGARPDFQQLAGIYGPKAEFFMAVFYFMRAWAYQYSANVQVTWMPELWPGMLLRLPNYNFQAYITTVQHDFSMGSDGSFTTSVALAAPSRISQGNPLFYGLPLAGSARPPSTYVADDQRYWQATGNHKDANQFGT